MAKRVWRGMAIKIYQIKPDHQYWSPLLTTGTAFYADRDMFKALKSISLEALFLMKPKCQNFFGSWLRKSSVIGNTCNI